MIATRTHIITPLAAAVVLSWSSAIAAQTTSVPELARQVEVRRTTHGVPHIRARNLKAAYYALGYVQLEDYGSRVAMGLLRARGEMGRWFGRDSVESDFGAQRDYNTAVENYARLEQPTRDAYEGFAAGVNRYIELHPQEFAPGLMHTSPATTSRRAMSRPPRRLRQTDSSPAWCLTLAGGADRVPRQPSRPMKVSIRSRKGRTRGRSRQAGRNRDARFCCGTRISRGRPATTKAR